MGRRAVKEEWQDLAVAVEEPLEYSGEYQNRCQWSGISPWISGQLYG